MTDRTCRVRWTWTDAVLEECERVLDAPERERLARFQHGGARRSFLAGRVTLRVTLGEVLDVAPANVPLDATCSRCGAPHGKPRVAATTDIEASLSHANGLVAVAVTSAGPVGVDVEEETHGEDLLECSDLVLGQAEFARLGTVAAPDRAASLLRAWTRKEAILKATGEGLPGDMTSLEVSAADASAALVRARTRPWLERHTFLHDLETPDGYLGSLAVLGAVTRVDAREFSTDDLRRALRLPR